MAVRNQGKKRKNEYVSLRPEAWRYWVEIRGLALDPELPELRVDYEKREISFDWRRMLDEFFGEEAYARRRLEEMETLNGIQIGRGLEGDAGAKVSSWEVTHVPEEGMIRDGELNGDTLLDTRRGVEEPETEAYLAARRQRIKKWYKKRNAQGLRDGEGSTSEAVLSSDGAERERVLEMLRLREDLAKDVSICDNANEVRAVYRWNPEHDSISL
ncbi:hypothetical protein SLS58_005878 [Diplodia intermedia]|uniref:Uncharacterized protein n=1 Tax=Diplodia intermedia TaxID=856260 RepID=A0ABR3TPR2_9PEZI